MRMIAAYALRYAKSVKEKGQTKRSPTHLCVVSPLKTVDQTCCYSYYVLERSTETDSQDVLVDRNPEEFRLEQLRPFLRCLDIPASDRRLTELVLRYLVRNVGSRKSSTFDSQVFLDNFRENVNLVILDFDSFDEGDRLSIFRDVTFELFAGIGNELMRNDKD